MSNPEIDTVKVSIMGREFKIRCPVDKTSELKEASDYLNSKMQEVRRGDKLTTIDRIAITAALNIAHEFILGKQTSESHADNFDSLNKKLLGLKHKIDEAVEAV